MAETFENYQSTKDIPIDPKAINQVIGQDDAVEIIKKAAEQRRHVLLIGEPGTGKSLLGFALAELLPKEKLVDIVAFPNPHDENQPLIRTMPSGTARDLVMRARIESASMFKNQNIIFLVVVFILSLIPFWLWKTGRISDVIFAASIITTAVAFIGVVFAMNIGKRMGGERVQIPKIIVDNFQKKQAPFFDATGAHAGALLGDVLHDPFQSGGLGTPAHERIIAGMIHKAHMGVLFVDEIATLQPHTQQELLTALQEGKYPITGQ